MKTTIGSAYIRHDVDWSTDHIGDIGKWETRRGIEIGDQFLPFPDERRSERFIVVEHLRTNAYGFYEGAGSEYGLFNGTLDEAERYWSHNCICGIINANASFVLRKNKNRISRFMPLRINLVRCQG